MEYKSTSFKIDKDKLSVIKQIARNKGLNVSIYLRLMIEDKIDFKNKIER